MKARLHRVLSSLKGRRVIVLGDLMLDEWLWGKVSRISPEAPIPVVDVERVTFTPGGACNVATNIASLGGHVELFGVVGNDEPGQRMLQALEQIGVDTGGVIFDDSRPTTHKTRIIAHNQQVVRADRESRAPIGEPETLWLIRAICDRIGAIDAILVSDYAKGVVVPPLLSSVIEATRRAGRPIVADPKGIDFSKYREVTVITPNKLEAAQACYIEMNDEASLLQAGGSLLGKLGCDAVLITRGEEGMSLFERAGATTHLPALARAVYDVTGAGDTVVATLTLALAAGASIVEAAHLANHAAGIAVSKVGTATVDQNELNQSLDEI